MGMSATQARYLNLVAQQSDLEFQGQQINESRTTLSEQTNNLYSQLQNLAVPTPPHTSDFTTIQYSGSLGADNFTVGKVVPSGATYTINLDYEKAGNSTYSAGKAEIKDTPQKVYGIKVADADKNSETITTAVTKGLIGQGNTVKDGDEILHKVTSKTDLDACITENTTDNKKPKVYVRQNNEFLEKDASNITDDDFKSGVYVKIKAKNDTKTVDNKEVTTPNNYIATTDYLYEGAGSKTIAPSIEFNEISSYYVMESDGTVRHANTSDFEYDSESKVYKFKSNVEYYKASTNTSGATELTNPDYTEGIGKSLNGNPLMDANNGITTYLTSEQKEAAIQALRNGFPEFANYDDTELLDLFYVSFSTEGSLKVPHFSLKTEVDGNLPNGSQTKWAEYYDITTTSTYTKTQTYDNCELTFDTSGRITKLSVPITDSQGNLTYQTVELKATTVTDEAAYAEAYNDYEYSKYQYDVEQLKINGQMSIIQEEDKKLELKLQRLDNERTQITTEMEALEKVINDNIESSYKTFSG